MSDPAWVTQERLTVDFRELGIQPDMLLMVHSSLSSIGKVLGGAETVVRTLLELLGPEGTLVMPAATPQCGDPAAWIKPSPLVEELPLLRDHLPLFDVRTTPTTLGIIPETFRNWPGTLRSNHPLESICANGPLAADITATHSLAFSEGRDGPFGRLYDLDARILLLGVGFNRCTALHFAESLSSRRRTATVRFPVIENGHRKWLEVPNVADDNDTHFPVVGNHYRQQYDPAGKPVGKAASLLFSMREMVDFAVKYFDQNL